LGAYDNGVPLGRRAGCFMPNLVPNEDAGADFVVELGGKFKAAYGTLTTALCAGLELKNKYEHADVKVYDRNERAMADTDAE
jgi:hypothetical protein